MPAGELEEFLTVDGAGAGTLRKSGGLLRQRAAVGAFLAVLGAACLLCLVVVSASHGSAGARNTSNGLGVSLNEAKVAPTSQEAEFLGAKASHALAALAAYYRSAENAEELFHTLVGEEGSSEFARKVAKKLREKNSSEWASEMRQTINQVLPHTLLNKTTLTAKEREELSRMLNSSGLVHDRHDGNICADDEELFHKLCYKKCRLFDNGKFPYRSTPFSCCETSPCGLFNHRLRMKICSGYNVAGDSYKDACPHTPGACLDNEELYLGKCYKRCSILTNLSFPFRLAPATCCKVPAKVACMNPALSKVSLDFSVGGGRYFGDATSPSQPHFPIPKLTEAGAEDTSVFDLSGA